MDDFRAASLAGWSSVAPDWGELISRVDRQLERAAEWMLGAVALEEGDRVLELAGGPGTLSLAAARDVGEGGEVICTDFAQPMVDAARARAGTDGASNMRFQVMDAEAIDMPDASVDVVLCRMGLMLMAEPAAALRESARVLTPGGRLAVAVWSEAQANPWAAVPMRAIMDHFGAPPPPPGAPGLWALADHDQFVALLAGAGFESITTETLEDRIEYASVEEWLELTGRLAGPVRALLANLDDAGRDAIRSAISSAAGDYRREDGSLVLPERMLVASALRP